MIIQAYVTISKNIIGKDIKLFQLFDNTSFCFIEKQDIIL
jgi:hypothetical protein